jgi:hypothetical protein
MHCLREAAAMIIRIDARWFQIAFLLSLLLFGVVARDFSITAFAAGARLCKRHAHPGRLAVAPRPADQIDVAGLPECDRLDSGHQHTRARGQRLVHPLLACIAMSSKYLLRMGPAECRSHVFNPANLAALLAYTVLARRLVESRPMGLGRSACALAHCLGGHRDAAHCTLGRQHRFFSVRGRCCWPAVSCGSGTPWEVGHAIWLQQISNGATLLFAFFMISDPMTTPQYARARIVYAIGVAIAAFVWQFVYFKPHGLILMLAAASIAVPIINRRWQQRRFEWAHARA